MTDAHDLVAAVKQLALDLDRTPTRAEFEASGRGFKYQMTRAFRNYAALLQAAGLESYSERRKIDNTIFKASIDTHLNEHRPRERVLPAEKSVWPRLQVISDIHWPFHHARLLQAFLDRIPVFGPEWVVLNGDAWDMYSHTKFPRSHNIFTPREEQERARAENVAFWKAVQERAPQAKCVQLLGNHDVRPLKRVLETYPAAEDWIARILAENFSFENVRTIFDAREELIIGNVAVFHGYRGALGAHRDFARMNCINGHTHKGGAVFRNINGTTLWELNSGLAGDPRGQRVDLYPSFDLSC